MYGQHEEFNPRVKRHTHEESQEAAVNIVNGQNGWDGNLYNYHFVDKDDMSQNAASKLNGQNGWDGNLYNYHFVDKDDESQKTASKLNGQNGWDGNNFEKFKNIVNNIGFDIDIDTLYLILILF